VLLLVLRRKNNDSDSSILWVSTVQLRVGEGLEIIVGNPPIHKNNSEWFLNISLMFFIKVFKLLGMDKKKNSKIPIV
jgi:16S rRNA G1207 methylase RsmC